ncbi:MAG: hypothetical protein U0667_16035 [Chloroflexota bacterium]
MRGMGTPREGRPLVTSHGPTAGHAMASCWARALVPWCSRTTRSPRRAARGCTPRWSATDAWATRGTSSSRSRRARAPRAMRWALQRYDVPADEVDLINPHGTSTPLGDLLKSPGHPYRVRRRAGEIAISSTKSMTGHLMGAAGTVEVFTVLSVHHQTAHGDHQLLDRPNPAQRGAWRERPWRSLPP